MEQKISDVGNKISDVGNKKLDSEEIFEEIVSLLHSYSMKLYSKRHANKKKIEIESHDQEIEIL